MRKFGISGGQEAVCRCGKTFIKRAHNQQNCSPKCKEARYSTPLQERLEWARRLARHGKPLPRGESANVRRAWRTVWAKRVFAA